ncbi:hypothetical protein HPP92_026422 [Vanilla planifolia]|uniref:Uncharacterized protein n=1 Tax=Vanilla planifolia TaxID=51239 RepID=A0A835USA2_VANPL|nr:hypothetical protein HPP92_026422 [Vanilla planifolia]KAG0473844.1 hypothetical protein HPP92_015701 [Vanilla planifolia]
MRQSSSRNQRSKGGFRLKHVLQICLLLAICVWLLYQVKHSHDKKRAFEERATKTSSKMTDQQPDTFNLGRKGLPLVKENESMSETHSTMVEDEEEGQDGEQEHEQDLRQEEAEDEEGKGGVDDGIDEQDQDGGDDENEHDEEFASEEERDVLVEEHEDDTREAREENYKRDDVSSAVAHDSRTTEREADGMGVEEGGLDEDQMGNHERGDAVVESMDRTAKSYVNSTLVYSANMSNISTTAFASGGNITIPNADLPVNDISSMKNGSEAEVYAPNTTKELHPNTTTALVENTVEVSALPTAKVLDDQMPAVEFTTSNTSDNVASTQTPLHGAITEESTSRLTLPSIQDELKHNNVVSAK